MCMVFCSSRTLPDAASSALEGTQPLLTHVPPMSCPSMTAVLRPCAWQRAVEQVWACQHHHARGVHATYRLDGMQRCSMTPHSTPDDNQVVVILLLGLGYGAQASAYAILARPVSRTGSVTTQLFMHALKDAGFHCHRMRCASPCIAAPGHTPKCQKVLQDTAFGCLPGAKSTGYSEHIR